MTALDTRAATAAPELAPPRWRSPGTVAAAAGLGYLLVGLALLPGYRYQLNPDGVSYLAIAHHYADGYWSEAVNGYWGPLYSWLLAPAIAAGLDGLLVAKCLNLVLGLGTLAGVWALAGRYTERPWLRAVAVVTMVPVLLGWAYALVTPDLTLVTVLLWYLYAMTAPTFATAWRWAVLAGALGGVAYLGKAYAFPFFLAHFLLVGAWRCYRAGAGNRGRVARVILLGLAAFVAVAGPWIAVISAKYHKLTYGTTSAYNWNLIGPGNLDHPTHLPGLIPPDGPHSTSGWEDPGKFVLPTWSAADEPVHLIKVLAGNAVDMALIVLHFTPLAVVIVPVALVAAVWSRRLSAEQRGRIGFGVITAAVFGLGYLIVVVEPRYIWLILTLLLMSGLLLVDGYRTRLGRAGTAVTTAVLVLSFWAPAAAVLRDGHGVGADDARTAQLIRDHAPDVAGHRIASNAEYRSSLFVTYHLAGQYYGMVPTTDGEASRQLGADGVEYLLWWGDAAVPGYVTNRVPVFAEQDEHLQVFRLR